MQQLSLPVLRSLGAGLPPCQPGKSHLPEDMCFLSTRWSLQGAGCRGNCLSFPQCCGRPRDLRDFHPISGASEPWVGPPVTSSPPPPGSSNLQNRNCEGQEWRVGFPANREGLAGRFLQDHPPLRRKRGKKGPSLSSCFCFS